MTVASVKRHSSIAIFASILLVAFLAQLPGAVAQASTTKVSSATLKVSVGASVGVFDSSAPGKNSRGVLTGRAARTSGLMCFGHRATIIGTNHADRLYGTTAVDVIVGLGGDDLISSGNSNDFICGGMGDDQMYGLSGNDQIDGGDGADTLYGGDGNDKLYGDGGNDTINGEGGTDYIYGGLGQDTLYGGDSGGTTTPATTGTAGGTRGLSGDSDNFIYGGPGGDTIDGGPMNDNLYGQGGNDTLMGEDGADRMVGGPGRDVFIGGNGNDTMTGGPADDSFDGEDGNDTVYGDGGLDVVNGGAGQDTVYGGAGNDLLNGGPGGDTLHGDGDNDLICGGTEVDSLYGGDGNDLISGEGDCTWDPKDIADVFSTDTAVSNLIDGGAGTDACVSPSRPKSGGQTIHCESDGLVALTISVTPGGNVDGLPIDFLGNPIFCDSSLSVDKCTFYFAAGDVVTLTANETSGTFTGWSGVIGCGVLPTCSVTMNDNETVTATFKVPTLTVVKAGTGTVTSSPGGISCGSTCSAQFSAGSSVTLTSTSASTTWGPPCPAGPSATCTLVLSADTTVTATIP